MVTKPGIDKAYGIRKLRDVLGISLNDMIFIGDALFPGGNDYAAEQAGVVSMAVLTPDDTKRVIETMMPVYRITVRKRFEFNARARPAIAC
jgi:hypothetical protein